MPRHLFLVLLTLFSAIAGAQAVENRRERVVSAVASQSLLVLGSEDRRSGFGASIQWLNPEKRLAFRRYPAKLGYEFYALHTTGHDTTGRRPGVTTTAAGALVFARYEFPARSIRMFFDLGWGLQVADRISQDLDTRLNSTPMFGAGIIVGRERPVYIALRLLHMSNAGTNKPNQGQNQLQLLVGVRF